MVNVTGYNFLKLIPTCEEREKGGGVLCKEAVKKLQNKMMQFLLQILLNPALNYSFMTIALKQTGVVYFDQFLNAAKRRKMSENGPTKSCKD